MRLIPDWRKAYRMMSVQAAIVLSLLATAYEYLPALQGYLPEGWMKWAALVVIVARLIQQPRLGRDQIEEG